MCAPTSLQRRRAKPVHWPKHHVDQSRISSETKWKLARRAFTLVLMWPVTLVLGVVDTLQHTVLEEPSDYRARRQESTGSEKHPHLWNLSHPHKDRGLLILRRFAVASQASTSMLVQVVFYFVVLHLLQFFGLDALIYALKPDLEWLLGKLTGTLYKLRDGQEIPLSLPGCLDPQFDLPYDPVQSFPQIPSEIPAAPTRLTVIHHAHKRSNCMSKTDDASLSQHSSSAQLRASCPSPSHHQSAHYEDQLHIIAYDSPADSSCRASTAAGDSSGNSIVGTRVPPVRVQVDCPLTAHFMAVAAKLIYEAPEIIADCLEHRWGFTLHDMQHIFGHAERECWLPDLVWCICSNERAVVLMMKGADPVYQLDLRADPPCIKSHRPGVGEVHDGLWAGLHQQDPASSAGGRVVDRILRCLQQVCERKQIFLSGHSLGGGLVTMLSLILPTRWPGFAARVGGIFTYGAPRIGNAETASIVGALYHGRSFRYMHGSDMVCSLPPAWGYEHCGLERFLLSFPWISPEVGRPPTRLVKQEADEALLKRTKQREDRMAFPFAFCKLLMGLREESFVRLASRATLLPWPGFSDHFPYGYVEALGKELDVQQSSG